MSGDPEMGKLLDKRFDDEEGLKAALNKYRATLAGKPGKTVIDNFTDLVVNTYTLLNPKNEGAGAVDLVWAEEEMYKKLVESTGRTIGKEHERTGLRLF